MTNSKIIKTNWYPDKKLLVTQVSGDIEIPDIKKWEKSLNEALNKIDDYESFKMFVNMYDFKAIDIDTHKRFRGIIPLTLANYGWKVGYLNLFEEEAKTITYKNTRGIKCIGVAHSYHDEAKMDLYENRFSCDKEHFFKDPSEAIDWIESLKLEE
ncbi:hypothetical protein [Aequorivita sediminis]|uniref:hypothetical protein n=1 Tax=Aequorivita sediminis TaxID=3073653 RepID=UPI0028B1270C|nr:hypothetical protein [Aequorivita sp. F6058]